jgi:hypothetical protein
MCRSEKKQGDRPHKNGCTDQRKLCLGQTPEAQAKESEVQRTEMDGELGDAADDRIH